jgi:hypothetical protein
MTRTVEQRDTAIRALSYSLAPVDMLPSQLLRRLFPRRCRRLSQPA